MFSFFRFIVCQMFHQQPFCLCVLSLYLFLSSKHWRCANFTSFFCSWGTDQIWLEQLKKKIISSHHSWVSSSWVILQYLEGFFFLFYCTATVAVPTCIKASIPCAITAILHVHIMSHCARRKVCCNVTKHQISDVWMGDEWNNSDGNINSRDTFFGLKSAVNFHMARPKISQCFRGNVSKECCCFLQYWIYRIFPLM